MYSTLPYSVPPPVIFPGSIQQGCDADHIGGSYGQCESKEMNTEDYASGDETEDCTDAFLARVDVTDNESTDDMDKAINQLFENGTVDTDLSANIDVTAHCQDAHQTQFESANCDKAIEFEVRGILEQGTNYVSFGQGPHFENVESVPSRLLARASPWSSDLAAFSTKRPFTLLLYVRIGNKFIKFDGSSGCPEVLQWPQDRSKLETTFCMFPPPTA
jgi:hypothetical protein